MSHRHPAVRFPRISLRRAALALAAVFLLFAVPAKAGPAVNAEGGKLALHGYDAVAYFTDGAARKGSQEFETQWMGAAWRFASAEHRDAFAAEPSKYAPQYGGFCAYAVSQGGTADIDPEAWTVVDGKLYLNLSKKIQKIWEKDIPGYIAAADANWPKIEAGLEK